MALRAAASLPVTQRWQTSAGHPPLSEPPPPGVSCDASRFTPHLALGLPGEV